MDTVLTVGCNRNVGDRMSTCPLAYEAIENEYWGKTYSSTPCLCRNAYIFLFGLWINSEVEFLRNKKRRIDQGRLETEREEGTCPRSWVQRLHFSKHFLSRHLEKSKHDLATLTSGNKPIQSAWAFPISSGCRCGVLRGDTARVHDANC